ncbi:MAG: ribosome maturation factor RimM [Oribacterium sp.]|nr:ribosome maturation factor RimM [Oribacterium sp.]
MQKKLTVGKIVTTHGLKGEVKVYPTTEDPDRFLDLSRVWLDLGVSGYKELEVEYVRFQKNMVLVKFKGLDRIEDVQSFRDHMLLVDREDAIPLKEGEYFVGDVIGLTVITDEDVTLGTVSDIMETGANNVFIVKDDTGREYLIPHSPNIVKEINPEEGYVRIHVIPGLLELT